MDQRRIHASQIGFIPWQAFANAVRIIGGSGSGKTVLAGWIAYLFFLNMQANIIFDPTGSLIANFLNRVQRYIEHQRLSDREEAAIWSRVVYCDLSGQSGYVVPFSMLRRFDHEPLSAVADRVMDWILLAQPESRGASIQGYAAVSKVVRPAAMILAALAPDLQITELPDLLSNIKQPHWKAALDLAAQRYPQQTAEALSFLRSEFSNWQGQNLERRLDLTESVFVPFRYSPAFRTVFGAAAPGLDYDDIIAQGKTVLVDASGLDGEYKQLMLNWILFGSVVPFTKNRGSGDFDPFGLSLEEVSTFYMDSPASMELMTHKFGELIHVIRRQYRVRLLVVHQSASQLHPQMAAHLAALGNQIVGRPADYDSALMLAEQLFDYQTLIKRWEPIYFSNRDRDAEVIDFRPVDYSQEEIRHMQARLLMRLDTFRFLARLTKTEGGGQTGLKQLDASALVGPFPDDREIRLLKQQLSAQSGVSVKRTLEEIEVRRQTGVKAVASSAIVPSTDPYDDDGYLLIPDDDESGFSA